MKRFTLFALLLSSLVGFAIANPVVVYTVNFNGAASGAIAGTQIGIEQNLPGGTWSTGGGWNWSSVSANGNRVALGEEHADACLPIFSSGDYVCPNILVVTATLNHSQGKGGIGFWPEPTLASGRYEEDGESVLHQYNSTVGFSGIIFDQARTSDNFVNRPATLQLAENGSLVGSAINVNISSNTYDEVSLTVNLTTGELLAVFLNGEPVTGFPTTTVFTAAASRYAGLISWNGGRTSSQSFSVVEGATDAEPEIFVDPVEVLAYAGTEVRTGVTARRSDNHEALSATVSSFDGGNDYAFVNGLFVWTSTTAGVYTVTFETELNNQTAQASAVFTVIDRPQGDTSVIYGVNCVGDYSGNIEGTDLCIVTNQPGAVWGVSTGFDWSRPTANGSSINLGEEKAAAYLPVFSTNTYIRPSMLTISAKFRCPQNDRDKNGVGFWSAPPDRYYSPGGFTGLIHSWRNETLQLAVNGNTVGAAVAVTPSGETYEEINYTINTTTGELLYVFFNGERVLGLPATTAFTEAATQYAGALSWSGGRMQFETFSLTEGQIPDPTPVLTVDPLTVVDFVDKPLSVTATAVNSDTTEAIPVTVVSFDGGAYSFANGIFSWTAATAGTYTVTFHTGIGSATIDKSAVFDVYDRPVNLGTCDPIYLTDLTGVSSGIQFAGSTWDDAEGRTDTGLVANLPGGVWIWGSGFNWAIPQTTGNAWYGLGDERACVLLPLASNGDYTKPMKFKVDVTFGSLTGMGLVGFWSQSPYEATSQSLSVYTGFTGLRASTAHKTLQLFVDGVAQGDAVAIPFENASDGVTLSFLVNTERGTVSNVTWEGFLIPGFETQAFTDAATAYVGFGVGANGPVNSRGSVSAFEVSVPRPESTVLLLR